jgi:signal transduction histidine kinase
MISISEARARLFLGVDCAIVSCVEGERYTVTHFQAPGAPLVRGLHFALGETYCAIMLQADDVLSIDEMGQSPYSGHPCYQTQQLESYIGAPLLVNGQRYGTVNFSSPEPRAEPWTEEDRQLVRLVTAMIGGVLERRGADEALQRTLNGLRRSNEMLSRFAARVSHDIKGPLRNISMLLELLEDEQAREDRELIGILQDSVHQRLDQILALVDGLLSWSRGGWGAAPEEVEVDELVQECLAFALMPPDFEVTTAIGVERLRAPRAAIAQVLRNLLANAVRHHDRPDGRISVVVSPEGRFARFEVSDDGPGVPIEHQQRVFEPFRSLGGGTGLGLSLVRETVALYGGEIALHSEGRGAAFAFTWPLRTEALEDL